ELITPRISDDSRETRVHRIDVHDIRHVEDGVRIVLHSIGLYEIALIIYAQELWTGVGNVHPYGRRPGSAIERDPQRPTRPVADIGPLVVRVEERSHRLVIVVECRLRSHGNAVGNVATIDGHLVGFAYGGIGDDANVATRVA